MFGVRHCTGRCTGGCVLKDNQNRHTLKVTKPNSTWTRSMITTRSVSAVCVDVCGVLCDSVCVVVCQGLCQCWWVGGWVCVCVCGVYHVARVSPAFSHSLFLAGHRFASLISVSLSSIWPPIPFGHSLLLATHLFWSLISVINQRFSALFLIRYSDGCFGPHGPSPPIGPPSFSQLRLLCN